MPSASPLEASVLTPLNSLAAASETPKLLMDTIIATPSDMDFLLDLLLSFLISAAVLAGSSSGRFSIRVWTNSASLFIFSD